MKKTESKKSQQGKKPQPKSQPTVGSGFTGPVAPDPDEDDEKMKQLLTVNLGSNPQPVRPSAPPSHGPAAATQQAPAQQRPPQQQVQRPAAAAPQTHQGQTQQRIPRQEINVDLNGTIIEIEGVPRETHHCRVNVRHGKPGSLDAHMKSIPGFPRNYFTTNIELTPRQWQYINGLQPGSALDVIVNVEDEANVSLTRPGYADLSSLVRPPDQAQPATQPAQPAAAGQQPTQTGTATPPNTVAIDPVMRDAIMQILRDRQQPQQTQTANQTPTPPQQPVGDRSIEEAEASGGYGILTVVTVCALGAMFSWLLFSLFQRPGAVAQAPQQPYSPPAVVIHDGAQGAQPVAQVGAPAASIMPATYRMTGTQPAVRKVTINPRFDEGQPNGSGGHVIAYTVQPNTEFTIYPPYPYLCDIRVVGAQSEYSYTCKLGDGQWVDHRMLQHGADGVARAVDVHKITTTPDAGTEVKVLINLFPSDWRPPSPASDNHGQSVL